MWSRSRFGRIFRFGGSAEPAGTVDRTTTEPNLYIYRRFYEFLGFSSEFFFNFGSAGDVITNERNRLLPENAAKALFLR